MINLNFFGLILFNACFKAKLLSVHEMGGGWAWVLSNDLFDSGLSGASGSIAYVAGSSPASYNITLTWNAKNVDNVSTTASNTTVNYNTSVVIYAGI